MQVIFAREKSRANWRTSRPRAGRGRFIFETFRLIVITRMGERNHLPVARQVTNCQERVTLVRQSTFGFRYSSRQALDSQWHEPRKTDGS